MKEMIENINIALPSWMWNELKEFGKLYFGKLQGLFPRYMIEKIIQEYLTTPKNYKTLAFFKKREYESDYEKIEVKLEELLEVSNNISIDMLITFLKIKKEMFFLNIVRWAKKFNFKLEGDNIVRKE